jgi:hypothetical protein
MKRRSAQRRTVYAPPQCIETRKELESEQEEGSWNLEASKDCVEERKHRPNLILQIKAHDRIMWILVSVTNMF